MSLPPIPKRLPRYREVTKAAVSAAGGPNAIARILPVSPQAAWQWQISGRVPERWVEAMADLSGYSAAELRPDLFTNGEAK